MRRVFCTDLVLLPQPWLALSLPTLRGHGSRKVLLWLSSKDAFPADWKLVKDELAQVLACRDPQAVKDYARDVAKAPRPLRVTTGSREQAVLLAMVCQRMAAAALRQMGVSAVTGVQSGKLRFNLVNGYLAQRLLFEDGLTRKPVSLAKFRLIWPVVWQKKFLMPLVQPKGIYNFYSRRCITRLAHRIGGRRTLEVAAGDGTLTRFLCSEGVDIIATDDLSWP